MENRLTYTKHLYYKLKCLFIIILTANNLQSQVYINEIMVNPAGSNDGSNMPNTSEWIEFYNSSTSAINVGCWYFTDGDFSVTFPSGTTIPAGGYYTVASASGSGLTPNLDWATCGCTTNNPANNSSLSGNQVGIFTNGNEQVVLYDNSGNMQDAVIWGGGQLANLTLTINATASCASKTLAITTSTVGYENIGTQSDGIAKERSIDGGSVWQNSGIGSFGGTNASVLPVELIGFEVRKTNNTIEISWTTASETNNDYFELEKSTDGINFFSIAIIKGQGVSKSTNKYNTEDYGQTYGITYYRLKQTDFDGSFSYSNIIYIENNNYDLYSVSPNPSNDGIFKLNNKTNQTIKVNVISQLGTIVYSEYTDAVINLSFLEKGTYTIVIVSEKNIQTQKIIIN